MSRTARLLGPLLVAAGALVTPPDAPAQDPESPAATCPDVRAREFDFWVGDWDVLNRHRQPDSDDPRWYNTGASTSRVRPIVGGCGFLEQWVGDLTFDQIRGMSVRTFDPALEQWQIVILWPSPNQPTFGTLEGSFGHGRGEFYTEGIDQHGRPVLTRFTFADIAPDRLRWDAAASGDSGITWRTNWIMEFSRHPAGESIVRPAWVDTTVRCDFPQMFELEFMLGAWEGTATLQNGSEAPVTLVSKRTLGGCAVEDHMRVGGGSWESYEIRTFDQAVRAWVAYRLDTTRPVLQRLEGSVQGADAQLVGSRQDGEDEIVVMGRPGIRRRRNDVVQHPGGRADPDAESRALTRSVSWPRA